MFPKAYFAGAFFAPQYFAPVTDAEIVASGSVFRGMMANLGRMMGA